MGAAPEDFDSTAALQQEALGVLGVNLIHGAVYRNDDPPALIGSLMDELSRERVEIDMLKLSGPAFAGVDNRLMSLQLVEQNLTDAAMFTAIGTCCPADRQRTACRHTSRSTQEPSGRIRPVLSAVGTKLSAANMPPSRRGQRTKASRPTRQPSVKEICGW